MGQISIKLIKLFEMILADMTRFMLVLNSTHCQFSFSRFVSTSAYKVSAEVN
jgi:hypothetical protein